MQIIIMISTVLLFVFLGFMMSMSIKKYEARKASSKKKKGRNKYIPPSHTPGRK